MYKLFIYTCMNDLSAIEAVWMSAEFFSFYFSFIYLGGFRVKGFIIGVHNGILQKKVSSEYLRNPRIPLLTGILGFLRYSQNTRFLKILINIEFINLPSF